MTPFELITASCVAFAEVLGADIAAAGIFTQPTVRENFHLAGEPRINFLRFAVEVLRILLSPRV